MCRLFGAISSQQVIASYLLIDAPASLYRQSHIDPKRKQGDGWGIGYFSGSRPHIIKSAKPLYKEEAKLRRAAKQVKGKVLIGHVRWASNPLKLAKGELIGTVHSQPFSYKNWLFAHNGTLLIPKEVQAELGAWSKHIKGKNDSEVLFYWLMKHLTGNVLQSVRKSLRNLDMIWKTCRKKYPLYKYPYHGLNWVLSNGKILIAQCYVNPAGFGKAKALGNRKKAYYQLHYKHDASGWVVASEPLDQDPGWKAMSHGQLLIADAEKGTFQWL